MATLAYPTIDTHRPYRRRRLGRAPDPERFPDGFLRWRHMDLPGLSAEELLRERKVVAGVVRYMQRRRRLTWWFPERLARIDEELWARGLVRR